MVCVIQCTQADDTETHTTCCTYLFLFDFHLSTACLDPYVYPSSNWSLLEGPREVNGVETLQWL